MGTRTFQDLLQLQHTEGRHLCVGLDPDMDKIPSSVGQGTIHSVLFGFGRSIVDATRHVAAVYKPNSAFYEAWGDDGILALRNTITHIHNSAPDVPVILDVKRGEIGNTGEQYAKAAFDYHQADAVTLSPYMGYDSVEPFLRRSEKGCFILCRTSNDGAGEFQDLEITPGVPLYRRVASQVVLNWNKNQNCGLVVGAKRAADISAVRAEVSNLMPLLIPGVGAQGGDLEAAVKAAAGSEGAGLFLVNSSRGIIYASPGSDFAERAGKAAEDLHNQMAAIVRQLQLQHA